MDRMGSNIDDCIKSIEHRLNTKVILLSTIQKGDDQCIKSIIDLVKLEEVSYDQNGNEILKSVNGDNEYLEKHRKIIEAAADYDDGVADLYLNNKPVPYDLLVNAIKKAIFSCKYCGAFAGSALRNQGVYNVMDGILNYIPSPIDLATSGVKAEENGSIFKALAFKIINDKKKDMITLIKVYEGCLKLKDKMYNATTKREERFSSIARIRADEYSNMNEVKAGDICALIGCTHTKSGETLTSAHDGNMQPLEGMTMPEYVFFSSIETESSKVLHQLEVALEKYCREDTSITYNFNKETGQMIVYGMGELHLEIMKERMHSEYGLTIKMGRVQVSYREAAGAKIENIIELNERYINDRLYAKIKLRIEPIEQESNEFVINIANKGVRIQHYDTKNEVDTFKSLETLSSEIVSEMKATALFKLSCGPLTRSKMIKTKIEVIDGLWSNRRSSPMAFKMAISRLMKVMLPKVSPYILEPYVKLEITAPIQYSASIIHDLTSTKNGNIIECIDDIGIRHYKIIKAVAPLESISSYSTHLRILTKGEGSMATEYFKYDRVSAEKQDKILKRII